MRRHSRGVSVSFNPQIATIVGDFEIKNVDVYAFYRNQRVTKVPPGEKFDIVAEYDIYNHNVGAPWEAAWSTCLTVFDETKGEPVGKDEFHERGYGWDHGKDRVAVTMPSYPVIYRVKIFASQGAWGAGFPPVDKW